MSGAAQGSIVNASAVEHRPANLVSQSRIFQYEFTNRIGKLFALPATLCPSGVFALAFKGWRTRRLYRISRSARLMCNDVRHHCHLASSGGGVPRRFKKVQDVFCTQPPWLLKIGSVVSLVTRNAVSRVGARHG